MIILLRSCLKYIIICSRNSDCNAWNHSPSPIFNRFTENSGFGLGRPHGECREP